VQRVSDQAPRKIAQAEKREAAARLVALGWSYERVAREGNLGYRTKQAVGKAMKVVLAERLARQDRAADELVQQELMVIEAALAKAAEIMDKVHLAHSNGRLITRELEDGTEVEVEDSGPQLAAADRLVRFSESRRKLLGLDAPTKSQASVESTISYVIQASSEELEQL